MGKRRTPKRRTKIMDTQGTVVGFSFLATAHFSKGFKERPSPPCQFTDSATLCGWVPNKIEAKEVRSDEMRREKRRQPKKNNRVAKGNETLWEEIERRKKRVPR